jgi:hypothetical protein
VRFAVESWSPEYAAPYEAPGEQEDERGRVDASVELPPDKWQPLTPVAAPAASVLFVDGVQQIDARIWVTDGDMSRMGLCVSLAAGRVRCDGQARVESVAVRRVAFGPAGLGAIVCDGLAYDSAAIADQTALENAVRSRREDLEVEVARGAGEADLIVLDGHVRQRETVADAAGFLKTHQAQYLEAEQAAVVGRLNAGQRTPVFLLQTAWSRYTWYLKLPGGEGHPWSGVVRCEASDSLKAAEAIEFAEYVSATLPRFASQPHKEPRAPQNLYPIAGLERELRRRLGDRLLLLRALQKASKLS